MGLKWRVKKARDTTPGLDLRFLRVLNILRSAQVTLIFETTAELRMMEAKGQSPTRMAPPRLLQSVMVQILFEASERREKEGI